MPQDKSTTKNIPFAQAKEVYDSSFRVARTTISVVDAMCQRGAVKGEELSAIGQLRDQCVQLAQLCEEFQSENEE
jgi:predicted methyltransferase